MPSDRISVLLAGSEEDLGDSLQEVLGNEGWIDVVGTSTSEQRILELAKELSPEVIVMDLGFAGDGLQTTQQLLKVSPPREQDHRPKHLRLCRAHRGTNDSQGEPSGARIGRVAIEKFAARGIAIVPF